MAFKYKPQQILGPGDSIREELEFYHWSQKDLSEILNTSEKHISHLLNNKVPITMEMAKLLSKVFKQSPQFWINLDTNYRLQLEETAIEKTTAAKALIFRYMPINQMRKLGWLPEYDKNKPETLFSAVLDFWKIKELKFDFMEKQAAACFRKSEAFEQFNPFYALTWLQKAKLETENCTIKNYKKNKLNSLASRIPEFSLLENGIKKFVVELSNCGVFFLHLPHLPQTYTDGASFYQKDNPVLVYTARYNRNDNFWFTIAHEIGHILLHLKTSKNFFIDSLDHILEEDKREEEANEFAQTILKNKEILEQVELYENITGNTIISICKAVNIAPCIIVALLQFEGIISYAKMNGFKGEVYYFGHYKILSETC